MPVSLAEADSEFAALMQELPAELVDLAYEFRAFCRGRQLRSVPDLLRAVLLYCGPDLGLRSVAANLTLLGQPLTDEAVRQRLLGCGPWLKAVLRQLLPTIPPDQVPGGRRLLVVDATTVQAPGATTSDYRVHLELDLVQLELVAVKLTDQSTGETLANYSFQSGDVVLGDRAYAHAARIVSLHQQGVAVLLRHQPRQLPLYDLSGARWAEVESLQPQAPDSVQTFPVLIQSGGESVAAWLHAYRLPPEQAAQARRRVRRAQQKKGRKVTAQMLWLAEFVLLITTVPPSELSAATCLSLYRVRWQIELVIKRYKSLLDLDCLRARAGSKLAEVWLHGKLLYVLLLERRVRQQVTAAWHQPSQARVGTPWRVLQLLRAQLDPIITGARYWSQTLWAQALAVLAERPRRKRQLQQLPAQVVAWLNAQNQPQPSLVKA